MVFLQNEMSKRSETMFSWKCLNALKKTAFEDTIQTKIFIDKLIRLTVR